MPEKKELTRSPFRLPGVGKQIAKHLARLEIYSADDLLFHLPLRYQDRTQIQPIRSLVPAEEAVIEAVVVSVAKPPRGRTKLLCELKDDSGGRLWLRFFHALTFQKEAFVVGTKLRCYGQVRLGTLGLEMAHPELKVISPQKPIPIDQHLTPVYPATEGLSQYMLRKLTTNALYKMQGEAVWRELLPASVLSQETLPTIKEAIHFVHRPPREAGVDALIQNKTVAQKRLVFEELLAHRLGLLRLKEDFHHRQGISLHQQNHYTKTFREQLPFQLTGAQVRVAAEIADDLSRERPMLRLVQGDVGSGKTVIAALAMLQAIENGYQAVMMAPTELLAEQHARVFTRWLAPLSLDVVYLAGNVKGKARTIALEKIKNGEAKIVLGTHALFQEGVEFSKLALVVIDEQHRFGVHQRAELREKASSANIYPHQLIMTATPIPRTLAMSFYADLDCSVIDELPPGRTPIVTSVIADSRRDEVIARVKEACSAGRQVYWVCPLIDESEVLNCQAATVAFEQLQTALPNLKVGLIHGRMKSSEKENAMRAFSQGETHLLVATTVIEVGVDVPNASVMVIENAERMGLSQLHQLRGRVGRGSIASHCLLMYRHPVSPIAKERLTVMRESTDGFVIAQRDLELRGPGEVFGVKQTGELEFRVADLLRDSALLPSVQAAADQIVHNHPEVIHPLINRWLKKAGHDGKV